MGFLFDKTGPCPYRDRCGSFKAMKRNEAWIEEELRNHRDEGKSVDLLLWRLRHIRDVMERCLNFNGRCLRYWQFKERDEAVSPPALDHAVLAWLSSVSSRCLGGGRG
ncbi:hypothetical protein J7L65_05730 [Candidatus Bathyarchaeota archaeon]|nr:hypothetical protein [Candidatus Bathyarchaeota archaeon]